MLFRSAVSLWRGGCIIRAKLLTHIHAAFTSNPSIATLLVAPGIVSDLDAAQASWRRVSVLSITFGVPAPGLISALQYVDTMRRPVGSTSVIQGLRDFFGAHTYRRRDIDGVFHTLWSGDRSEIQKS